MGAAQTARPYGKSQRQQSPELEAQVVFEVGNIHQPMDHHREKREQNAEVHRPPVHVGVAPAAATTPAPSNNHRKRWLRASPMATAARARYPPREKLRRTQTTPTATNAPATVRSMRPGQCSITAPANATRGTR